MGVVACSFLKRLADHEPDRVAGGISPLRAVSRGPNYGAHGVTRPALRFMQNFTPPETQPLSILRFA